MSRVYLVQETDHSLIKAAPWGDLVPLLSRRHSLNRAADAGLIRAGLAQATPEDWLLPTGDPAAIAVAATEFARLTGVLRILRWSRVDDDYQPLEFSL